MKGADRPSWDDYFLDIATQVARRSTCLRRHVGAILVRDKRILATGYNGVPQKLAHCSERGCLRTQHAVPSGQRHELCRGLHAEMNALLQAAGYGVDIRGSILYTTDFPCSLCAKMLINVDVKKIIACGDYHDPLAKEMLAEAAIEVHCTHTKDRPVDE